MNTQILNAYKSGPHQDVIAIHEKEGLLYETLVQRAPDLPKGWFELAHLSPLDRVDFFASFWQSCFDYQPKVEEYITQFFLKVDDIYLFLVRKEGEIFYQPQLVYSLGSGGFYRGLAPVSEYNLEIFKQNCSWPLPDAFLSFLKIHNGFSKEGDHGILTLETILSEASLLQHQLLVDETKVFFESRAVDPTLLVPFYKSIGYMLYQCFYQNYYVAKEPGNIPILLAKRAQPSIYKLDKEECYPTFMDWLNSYLEVPYV